LTAVKEEKYVESLLILIPPPTFVIIADQHKKLCHAFLRVRTFPLNRVVISLVPAALSILSPHAVPYQVKSWEQTIPRQSQPEIKPE